MLLGGGEVPGKFRFLRIACGSNGLYESSPPCIPRQLPFRFHETSIIPPCIYNALSAGDEYASHSSLPLRNTGCNCHSKNFAEERISADKSETWRRNSISEKRRCIYFDFSRLIFRNVARARIFRGKYIGTMTPKCYQFSMSLHFYYFEDFYCSKSRTCYMSIAPNTRKTGRATTPNANYCRWKIGDDLSTEGCIYK